MIIDIYPLFFLLMDSQHCIILPMLIGEINIVAPTVDGKQIMLQREIGSNSH